MPTKRGPVLALAVVGCAGAVGILARDGGESSSDGVSAERGAQMYKLEL